jgi:MFS family permease
MNTFGSKTAAEWRHFWPLPVAGALGYATAVLHLYSIGSFIEPLQLEFGWTRAQISLGTTMTGLVGAALSVPVGMLIDRIGPRLVALLGIPLMTGSIALLSTADGQLLNWLMLWGAVAIGNLCVQATVWTSAVASRFEKSRGLAFAITLSGTSIAAIVSPVLATWLIGAYGWRTGFMALGGLWAALVFPTIFFFFRGAQDGGRKEGAIQGAKPALLKGMSVAEGLRAPVFYKLLWAGACFAFTAMGAVVHLVPILKSGGAAPLAAAGTASLVGVFSIVGQLGTGYLMDRFRGNQVGALLFLLPVAASALLLVHGVSPAGQSVAAVLFGLAIGSGFNVIATLAASHFGLKSFATLFGVLIGAMSLGTAFGPFAAGATFDRHGNYAPFLLATVVLMALCSLVLATLGHPRIAAVD